MIRLAFLTVLFTCLLSSLAPAWMAWEGKARACKYGHCLSVTAPNRIGGGTVNFYRETRWGVRGWMCRTTSPVKRQPFLKQCEPIGQN